MAGGPVGIAVTIDLLRTRLAAADSVRRVGQALWMMVGERVGIADLLWARAVIGANGDELLWQALHSSGVITEPDCVIQPRPLAEFLASLFDPRNNEEDATVVWTLPAEIAVAGACANGYAQAALQLIASATQSVIFVAPYVDSRGMGWLHTGLVAAIERGVSVTIITHDVQDVPSTTSMAIEALRRECSTSRGDLRVLAGVSRAHVFLHSKIVLVDDSRCLIGSANVTNSGFAANLETGVCISGRAARGVSQVLGSLMASKLVVLVYTNRRQFSG